MSARTISEVLAAAAALLILQAVVPAWALEAPATAATDFVSDSGSREVEQQRKEIEHILQTIEQQWNAHNLDAVMNFYADDYINNDGLDKKSVAALTQDFWKTYPDARSTSITKQIRVEGPFITVESRDMASGTTAKEMPGIGTKGELHSISEGQLYMKKIGNSWKIIGDRIDYEKVRVAFGLARSVQATFSAPEQVKSGRQYSAKLEVSLPQGMTGVGSITSQPLQYPQPQPTDYWRPLDSQSAVLERVMGANSRNRNELLMATIGVTNASRNSLMGIAFLTRRLNVVPNMDESAEAQAGTADGHGKPADKTKQ